MKTHRQNRTLAEKQVDIKNALLKGGSDGNLAWLSTNELARQIGMARNGGFKAMLDWMVECGSLQRREQANPKHWPGYEYAISEDIKRFYNRPLKINHRKNGKQVQSLELWS